MKPQRKIEGAGRKILVVDDELAIRVLLDTVLKRMHFTVDVAQDGDDALGKLGTGNYDLVFLDLMMPKVDGYELLSRIGNGRQARPHIIVFTAAGKEGLARIPEGSACRAILKPFDLEEFMAVISECLESEQVTAPAHPSTKMSPE
jgi:DNA-binding response OmpR family regulator